MGTVKNWSVSSNLIKDGRTLTGRLFFDEETFCFKADSVNGILNLGEINYNQIQQVQQKNIFGFIPNGLMVKLKDGTDLLFVPLKRKKVREYLIDKAKKE